MESIGVMLFRVTDAGDELIPVTLAQPHACKVFDLVGDQDSLTLIRTGCDNPSWLRWHWGNWDAPEQGDLSNTLAQPIKGFARSVQLDPWGGLHLLVEFTEFMEVADGIPLIGLPMVVQSEYVILDAQTLQLLWQETLYEGELPPGTVQDASYYEHRPRFSFHENQVQAYWATNQGLHIRALAPVLESQPTDG